MVTRFLVAAALTCAAGVASATQFPNPACPDSVTLRQIQDLTAACHPATGDTVGGAGGIIIGFDPIPSGFYTYLQTSGGGPFTGIEFFTHTKNLLAAPYEFAIGDSIVVEFAITVEFQGGTELQAPNNSFPAPNFVVRKVSPGHALPPFFLGTTTQLKETSTNTLFEQYEGCLVKLQGPLTVVRTSATGGLGANNLFLVVNPDAPDDSVLVDGNKLVMITPPAVGTPLISVQGVGGQATRGYRIMLRDGTDIVFKTPPNVLDAFPLTDNTIKVIFDRPVTTASGTTLTNYSLASFGSVNAASMIDQSSVQLTITNGLGHGSLETVTINHVTGLEAGQTMTTPQSLTFINGLLTAAEIQLANPDSLSPTPACVDRSRFAGTGSQVGTRASMAATSAARYGLVYYMMDETPSHRGGLAAFAPPAVLTIGRQYRLTGKVQEFFGETELSSIIEATDIGPGTVPSPATITALHALRDTCEESNLFEDGEDYEGRLVTLPFVKVVQRGSPPPTNGFHVADQSLPDTIFVENFNGVLTPLVTPPLGAIVSVTGVVHYSSGSFRVIPRNYADIVDESTTDVGGPTHEVAFSVHPNPARTASFSFSLPEAGNVEIDIFDVAGRQVATIFHGWLPAGRYSRDWSAGSDGRSVRAGVFFARLKASGQIRCLRTVLLGR